MYFCSRFPRYFCFHGCLRRFKAINARTFRTYVRQFVSSPEGCKLKNTWLLCTGLWCGEVAASSSLSDSAVVCHISVHVVNCLHPPGPHASAVSLNLTLAFCTKADTYLMEKKNQTSMAFQNFQPFFPFLLSHLKAEHCVC